MTTTRDHKRGGAAVVPHIRPTPAEAKANRVVERRGEPLPASVRTSHETQFGADFADVRVHTDRAAAEATEALGARAFTIGRHIAFNEGEFKPAATAGQRLITHELAHAEQQRHAADGHAVFLPNAAEEREAHAAADGVAQGHTVRGKATSRGGSRRIQADDGKGTQAQGTGDKTSGQPPSGARITFVLRAPDDVYTRDVSDYAKNSLNEQVVEVDNIQEAAEYVAKYAKDNKTKVSEIRIIGHGSTTGGMKMTPKGEQDRRFVTAQELEQMSTDQKLKAIAGSGMAEGATVEFWGCYVGRSDTTSKAVAAIFNADFKAIDATLRTSSDSFLRPADKGEGGIEVSGHKGKWIEAKSTSEIDERVAQGDKTLGASFNKWLVAKGKQMEADGDLPAQPDDASRITAMREVFDRSRGSIKRLEIESDNKTVHRSDKQKWLRKWKTVKAK